MEFSILACVNVANTYMPNLHIFKGKGEQGITSKNVRKEKLWQCIQRPKWQLVRFLESRCFILQNLWKEIYLELIIISLCLMGMDFISPCKLSHLNTTWVKPFSKHKSCLTTSWCTTCFKSFKITYKLIIGE